MGNSSSIQTIKYSVPVSEPRQGETPIYRNPDCAGKALATIPNSGAKNLQEALLDSPKKFPERNCLGSRKGPNRQYVHKNYREVFELGKQIGSGIINLNLIPEIKQHEGLDLKLVGVHASNREEWVILDIANILFGNTMVPLYDSLGPDTIEYVLNHSEITTCFCQLSTIKSLLQCNDTPNLKNIVMMEEISQEILELAKSKNIKIFQWEEVLQAGKQNPQNLPEISPKCCLTFSYTSGTTGLPKAVMISHANLLGVYAAVEDQQPKVNENDVHLSYLPLAHVFERIMILGYLATGSSINFFGGDLLKLKDDLADVKPTIFVSVPRLYNKFYSGIQAKFEQAEGLKKFLVSKGLNSKLENLQQKGETTHKLWDSLIFGKTKALLGGRCRMMISGSAPISNDVINFLKITMACPFKEGYGLTETSTGGFLSRVEDISTGHVGGPTTAVEVKLKDVPEMNYTSKDKDEQGRDQPRGEICFRGTCIFQGYYKDKQKTEEALDKDGWFHTGDIGMRLPSGAFKIIDRKKNIFKLAQGEYVAPEKVENIYVRAPAVEQAFLHGDSLENFCIGVIHPNEQVFIELAKKNNQSGTFEELCKNEVMKKAILEIVTEYGKAEKLFGFEQAKKVLLVHKNFSEYDCLTNTMKLQRYKAKISFKEDLAKIYRESK